MVTLPCEDDAYQAPIGLAKKIISNYKFQQSKTTASRTQMKSKQKN